MLESLATAVRAAERQAAKAKAVWLTAELGATAPAATKAWQRWHEMRRERGLKPWTPRVES